MTLEEEGAYIRLIGYCWQYGSIPANPEEVSRLIGKGASTTVATTVLTMFQPSHEVGRLIHDRLEEERIKQELWREKSIAGGKKSAEIRAKMKGGSTVVATVVEKCLQPNVNSSVFSLQSSSSKEYIEHPSVNVEIPEFFPKTEADAVAVVDFVGCTKEFAITTWSNAMGRGGRDAHDVPIRNWQHHLKAMSSFDKNRTEKEKSYGKSNQKPNPRNFGTGIDPIEQGRATAELVKKRTEQYEAERAERERMAEKMD